MKLVLVLCFMTSRKRDLFTCTSPPKQTGVYTRQLISVECCHLDCPSEQSSFEAMALPLFTASMSYVVEYQCQYGISAIVTSKERKTITKSSRFISSERSTNTSLYTTLISTFIVTLYTNHRYFNKFHVIRSKSHRFTKVPTTPTFLTALFLAL